MRITRRFLGAWLIAGSVMASACGGDSPSAPSSSGPVNIAGTWLGTLTFNGSLPQGAVTLTLGQAAGSPSVTGTWTGKNKWSGTLDGSISGNAFAGQLVWNYEGAGPALSQCLASVALSGNAGGNAITWTSGSITRDAKSSVFCDLGVTSFRIDATK
jgi:hypothetical protein